MSRKLCERLTKPAFHTKLRWSKGGNPTKDVDDVKNVLTVQRGKLDLAYLRTWCGKYNILNLFEKLLSETPLPPA